MVCLSVRKVGSCLRTELCAPSTLRGPRPCTLIVDEDQPIVLMRLVNGPVLFPAPPRHKYNSDHITRGDGTSASYPTIRRLFMKVCLLHQQATDNAFCFRQRILFSSAIHSICVHDLSCKYPEAALRVGGEKGEI
jgi:hypothetical protein